MQQSKVTIEPEEVPEFRRHGKGDMLPGSSLKGVKAVFDPDISSLLAAGRAESGLAAMRYFDTFRACGTAKKMVSEKGCSAYEEF